MPENPAILYTQHDVFFKTYPYICSLSFECLKAAISHHTHIFCLGINENFTIAMVLVMYSLYFLKNRKTYHLTLALCTLGTIESFADVVNSCRRCKCLANKFRKLAHVVFYVCFMWVLSSIYSNLFTWNLLRIGDWLGILNKNELNLWTIYVNVVEYRSVCMNKCEETLMCYKSYSGYINMFSFRIIKF